MRGCICAVIRISLSPIRAGNLRDLKFQSVLWSCPRSEETRAQRIWSQSKVSKLCEKDQVMGVGQDKKRIYLGVQTRARPGRLSRNRLKETRLP